MHVMKTASDKGDDDKGEFWPRLLEDKHLEKNQVTIDWNRYVDEDEEDEVGGFDTSALEGGNMFGGAGGGGMGGMDMEALMRQMGSMENKGGGGMPDDFSPMDGDEPDSDDEDDEDLPDLE